LKSQSWFSFGRYRPVKIAALQPLEAETYVLGAFNPALTRLPNGNLLIVVGR
jgi:hypothetical protein